jgi:hypothetical protein
MADEFECPAPAALVNCHTGTDRHDRAIGNRCKLGAGQATAPVARVAQHRLAFVFRKLGQELRFQVRVTSLDQPEAASGNEIGPGRDRQLELGFEMLLVPFTAKGDAHRMDRVCAMVLPTSTKARLMASPLARSRFSA